MNSSPFGRAMIYLSNGASYMILSHANQMECSKQAVVSWPRPAAAPDGPAGCAGSGQGRRRHVWVCGARALCVGAARAGSYAQGQTERRHLEKYAAAELSPTPPRPSLFVRLPDKEGRAGRG